MQTVKERKITFHTLIKRQWRTQLETPYSEIQEIIKHILQLKKLDRKFDLKESKFCLLQSAAVEKQNNNIIIHGFFKSARDAFRPNLIDRITGDERKSPKKITEGDIEKTHFCIKIATEEVFLVVETNGHGITIGQMVDYFAWSIKKYYLINKIKKNFSLIYTKMGKEDFLAELKKIKRTRIAEVYFDKSLLGSNALNFSKRTISLKRDILLTATAEKNESIIETAIDFFNGYKSGNKSISKVRVYGKDDNNNNVILDTSFIEKVEQLNSSLNAQTGEIETQEILTNLKGLVKNL